MDDPVGAARALVHERFPDALAAFLGGSAAHGRATPTSDLDIVVVLPPGSEISADCLSWRGRPVELFRHTPESAALFIERSREQGTGTMAFLCADSVLLLDADGTGERLRATAARALADGPLAPGQAAVDQQRYIVTDLRDDLLGATDEDEVLAVAAALLGDASVLLSKALGQWRGGGKWLPRRLREADPELAGRLLGGYRTLARGGPREPFAEAVGAVLDRCGGPLWAGYRRTPDAAIQSRLKATQSTVRIGQEVGSDAREQG